MNRVAVLFVGFTLMAAPSGALFNPVGRQGLGEAVGPHVKKRTVPATVAVPVIVSVSVTGLPNPSEVAANWVDMIAVGGASLTLI